MKKPKNCCEIGSYECQVPMPLNGRRQDIDLCVADIVAALNAANIPTAASCCGHGVQKGVIALEDGRTLIILGVNKRQSMEKKPSVVKEEPVSAYLTMADICGVHLSPVPGETDLPFSSADLARMLPAAVVAALLGEGVTVQMKCFMRTYCVVANKGSDRVCTPVGVRKNETAQQAVFVSLEDAVKRLFKKITGTELPWPAKEDATPEVVPNAAKRKEAVCTVTHTAGLPDPPFVAEDIADMLFPPMLSYGGRPVRYSMCRVPEDGSPYYVRAVCCGRDMEVKVLRGQDETVRIAVREAAIKAFALLAQRLRMDDTRWLTG